MNVQETLPGFDDFVAADEQISPAEAYTRSAAACAAFEAQVLDPQNAHLQPLAESYLDARARGWEWRKALYIAWARLPRAARWPASLRELASVMGLRSDRTIRKWRYNNPEIDRLIVEEMLTRVGEHTAEVLAALAELASQPNYKSTRAMELYLRVHGIYTPEQKIQGEVQGPQFYLPETLTEDTDDGSASED